MKPQTILERVSIVTLLAACALSLPSPADGQAALPACTIHASASAVTVGQEFTVAWRLPAAGPVTLNGQQVANSGAHVVKASRIGLYDFLLASRTAPQGCQVSVRAVQNRLNTPKGFIRVLNADRMEALAQLNPTSAREFFDTDNAFALAIHGQAKTDAAVTSLIGRRWKVRFARGYFSVVDFESDIAAHRIIPEVSAVVYDNESGATPHNEQSGGGFDEPTSRRAATKRFAELAKKYNLTVILAPGGAICNFIRNESPSKMRKCFGYLADIAQYAEILDPQFQATISIPERHALLTQESAKHIRQANPSIRILSQFTTNPIRGFSPEQNISAIAAALPYVSGIWINLNLSSRGLTEGIDVLNHLRPAMTEATR